MNKRTNWLSSNQKHLGLVWKHESNGLNLKVRKVFHFTKKVNDGRLFGWLIEESETEFLLKQHIFSVMKVDLK